jgi:5-(carboxyamino)imidazole ribonucleotide synthase
MADCPAAQVAEIVVGAYDDPLALDRLVAGASLATYEFENVPLIAARHLAARLPVYPPPRALETAQDRLHEKALFRTLGIDTPDFAAVATWAELEAAVAQLGLPAVLKTRRLGYDGKGQAVLQTATDVAVAWKQLAQPAAQIGLILERFVTFDREVSLIAARSTVGEVVFYPLVENHHQDGILRLSLAPAPDLSPALQAQAEGYARSVLAALDYVGVLAIEFFQVGDRLLANEMAPRVHNSGHWTQDGAVTSQFENHLRAMTGLPLGDTSPLGRAAMVNLIGAIPDPAAVLAVPQAQLHLYGKAPRPGRKVGHINLVTPTAAERRTILARLQTLPGVQVDAHAFADA